MRAGHILEISVLSANLFCEPKLLLKVKSILKKIVPKQNNSNVDDEEWSDVQKFNARNVMWG